MSILDKHQLIVLYHSDFEASIVMFSPNLINSLIKKDFSDLNLNLSEPSLLKIDDKEVPISDDNFEFIKELGSGQFSVKKFIHKPSGKEVAVKEFPTPIKRIGIVKKRREIKINEIRKILNEIEIFNKLSAKDPAHIVQFYGWTANNEYVRIYMEPMHTSLRELSELRYHNNTNENGMISLVNTMIISVLCGLLTCREENISHGDLKPENILINLNGEVKLNDFGESRNLQGSKSISSAASIAYWSPEKFDYEKNQKCSLEDEEKYNVWSLGIIIIEILQGINPILAINNISAIDNLGLFQKAMKDPSYLNATMVNMRKGLGFYEEFVGECLRPYEIRPNYKILMENPVYKDIIARAVKEGRNFSTKEFITHLKEVRK